MMVLDKHQFVNNVEKVFILMVINVLNVLKHKFKIVKYIVMIKIDVLNVKIVI